MVESGWIEWEACPVSPLEMSINLKMIFLMDLPLLLIPVDVHLTQIPGIMPRRSFVFLLLLLPHPLD